MCLRTGGVVGGTRDPFGLQLLCTREPNLFTVVVHDCEPVGGKEPSDRLNVIKIVERRVSMQINCTAISSKGTLVGAPDEATRQVSSSWRRYRWSSVVGILLAQSLQPSTRACLMRNTRRHGARWSHRHPCLPHVQQRELFRSWRMARSCCVRIHMLVVPIVY